MNTILSYLKSDPSCVILAAMYNSLPGSHNVKEDVTMPYI